MPIRFIIYRIESFALLLLFVGAFVMTVQTGNVEWFILGWIPVAVGMFHLNRLKCPNCGNQVMRKKSKYVYIPRQFFPKKCDKCDFDFTKMK